MVEWQPYPNLPVYVVHPIDGAIPYIEMEQKECENAVKGDVSNEPTPVSHAEDALPAISWPEVNQKAYLNSLSKHCEPVSPGPTRSTNPDSVDEGLQADNEHLLH